MRSVRLAPLALLKDPDAHEWIFKDGCLAESDRSEKGMD